MPKPKLKQLSVDAIAFGANPRLIDEATDPGFAELVDSDKTHGIFQPIHVRAADGPAERAKSPPEKPLAQYILMAGERRLRAARKAGLKEVPAFDYGRLDPGEAINITIQENRHRQLSPLEEARETAMAMTACEGDIDRVAAMLGQTPRWVRMRARIEAHLTDDWKKALAEDYDVAWLTVGHLAVLARQPEESQVLLERNRWEFRRPMTIEALEAKLATEQRLLAKAPFDTGPCAQCTKRTGVSPLLWAESESQVTGNADRCLDPACFAEKSQAANRAQFKALAKKYKGLVALDARKDPNADYKLSQELAATYGTKVVRNAYKGSNDFTICKKTDPGALPALLVAGRDKGKVRYIQIEKPTSSGSGSAAGGKKAAGKKQPKAERGTAIHLAAWRGVYYECLDRIGATPVEALISPAVVLAVAAVFQEEVGYWPDRAVALAALRASADAGPEALTKYISTKVWLDVQASARNIRDVGWYSDEDVTAEARALAAVLGLDGSEMFEKAKAEQGGENATQ